MNYFRFDEMARDGGDLTGPANECIIGLRYLCDGDTTRSALVQCGSQ
jgi:hypothetical protein